MKNLARTLLLALIVLSALAQAAKERPFVDEPSTDRDDVEDGAPWEESEAGAVMPPWPEDGDLLEFNVDRSDSPFRYYVDGRNVRVGEDGVVRFTLVIKSRSGAANVSYEGMRCNVREYKVYAYGSRGKFRPVKGAQWERLNQSAYDLYRLDLRNFYLCRAENFQPRDEADILHRLAVGLPRGGESRDFY
jgi:hypothetical protein